jgi:hypothetical protein
MAAGAQNAQARPGASYITGQLTLIDGGNCVVEDKGSRDRC